MTEPAKLTAELQMKNIRLGVGMEFFDDRRLVPEIERQRERVRREYGTDHRKLKGFEKYIVALQSHFYTRVISYQRSSSHPMMSNQNRPIETR